MLPKSLHGICAPERGLAGCDALAMRSPTSWGWLPDPVEKHWCFLMIPTAIRRLKNLQNTTKCDLIRPFCETFQRSWMLWKSHLWVKSKNVFAITPDSMFRPYPLEIQQKSESLHSSHAPLDRLLAMDLTLASFITLENAHELLIAVSMHDCWQVLLCLSGYQMHRHLEFRTCEAFSHVQEVEQLCEQKQAKLGFAAILKRCKTISQHIDIPTVHSMPL